MGPQGGTLLSETNFRNAGHQGVEILREDVRRCADDGLAFQLAVGLDTNSKVLRGATNATGCADKGCI